MKRLIQKGEKSVALLLAFLMAFSSPLSVWAENGQEFSDGTDPIFSDGSGSNDDLLYTFSEEVSEDGLSSNVKLEVTEKEENTLTEVILPDGSSVYPDTQNEITGFKQDVDGVEKNIVYYEVTENGIVKFKLKYNVPIIPTVQEETDSEIQSKSESETQDEIQPETHSEPVKTENEIVPEVEQNTEMIETQKNSEQETESIEYQIDTEQNLLSKVMDTIFPVLEVQAANIESQPIEKEMIIEYQVNGIQDRTIMNTRGTVVATIDELNEAIANASDGDTITIDGSIDGVAVIDGKKITLTGGTLRALNITNGSDVTLENIVIDANKIGTESSGEWGATGGPAIIIKDSGIKLSNGSVIENAFMNDVNIFPNASYGGGIFAESSTIEMYDGAIIQNNEVYTVRNYSRGGGVALCHGSSMYMYGGTINNNKATNPSGYIEGSTGGGIFLNQDSDDNQFYMYGGEISQNTAEIGGGIFQYRGNVEISGGIIKENTATVGDHGDSLYESGLGAGVASLNIRNKKNILTIKGNAQIADNIADVSNAGIWSVDSVLNLFGGSITNNISLDSDKSKMSRYPVGGVGASYMANQKYQQVNIEGNTIITDNCVNDIRSNLGMEQDEYNCVNLTEKFTGKIGLSLADDKPALPSYMKDFIINGGENPTSELVQNVAEINANFFSDNTDYITRLEPDGDNHKVVLGFPKVTYNTRGGDFAPGEEQEFYTTANQPITKPSDPTFSDHAFIAWYTTPDYQDGTEFDFNTPITKDTDLYARWFPDVYFIDFDANGGTGTMDTIVQDGTESVNLPANAFTNGTYLFDGWNTEADGSGTPVAEGQTGYTPGKKDVTLYAQWKERTYTVKYDTGGGTPTTIADKDNVKFVDTGLLPADVIKKEGYTFTGWKVQGTDTKVENDTKYSDLVADYTISEVTLEALWSENTYTVKYDTNGGMPTAITDKTNVKFKDPGLLPADNPTRSGYTFNGWEVDGNKVIDTTTYKALVADDTVKLVTLVAQWEAKEYTVKYDSNGGTPVNVAEKEHVKFWDVDLLPADTMTKPGYTFGGWNYNTKPVSDTTKYSDLAADDTVKEITLTAQWIPKQYKVNYDVNGGKPDNYSSETVKFEDVVPIPADAPTKDGYDFKGWMKDTTKIDGTGVTYDSLVADDMVSEITLEAQWEEKSYTVKFELKPGERGGTLSGDTADQGVKYNQYAAAGADVNVSIDSAFLGWSYSYTPVGSITPISGTVVDYTTVPILNDVTFIANFAKVPFVSGISTKGFVSVQKGGAPADVGTSTVTKIEYDLTDALPAKAGFKFEGVLHYHIDEIKFNDLYNHEFTLDLNSKEKQMFTVGEDGHASAIQIAVDKAKGTVNITGIEESLKFNFAFAEDTKYTVSFQEEKGPADNWGQNTDLYTGDAMGKEPATNPVKQGYTFDGWSSDGSNTPDKMYDPDALVTDKDEVYYAVWTPKEYTVHYNTDGGTAVLDKTGVHYTDTGLTPADNPTKPGYTFDSWEKDTVKIAADTAYHTLVADDTVMEVTLTAKWEVKHFTASWVTKDGETLGSIDGGNQKEEGIAYNSNVTKDVTAVPASNDSEFIGWEYSYIPDGSTTPVLGFTNDYKTTPVLGDITFTAKFAAKPFVSIGAANGKVTAVKGTTPEEISGSSGTTALIQYTAADDIENNKGTAALKYAADMHHHLTTISFKDMFGHEYTIWTKDSGGTTAGPDYEVGGKTPATKVSVVIDEKNGTIQVSDIDTSLAFTVVFEEDPKYKVEFFREKDDPTSLVQTNDGLYTGNPVGQKPDADPAKPGYKFLGWSTDGSNDPDKMYDKDTLIQDQDIAYYGVWELIDYKLTISKTVDGEYGNLKQDFHFIVTLKDKDGTPLSGTYAYTGEAITGVGKPGTGNVTLDAEGKAEITLRHGQSIILDGLHIGEQYTIEETEANQNGYVTTVTGERNPNITGDCEVAFTNTRTTTPPTGIGPMNHFPTLILGVVFLLLTCVGFVWARRRRRA